MSFTRSAKVVFAVTAIAAILGVQTASANRAVLVDEDLCDDEMPLTPVTLSWLTDPAYGHAFNSIYVLSKENGIVPITKSAPDFKTVTDLFVLGHGDCGEILGMKSTKFATLMQGAFGENEPDNIILGACESGKLNSNSPAESLTLAFPKTTIKAFSTGVGILGNGSRSPKYWSFGQPFFWRTETVMKRIKLLVGNISKKWLADEEGATQKSCGDQLKEAMRNQGEDSFDRFANLTLEKFSNEHAEAGDYDISELYSYRVRHGLTACRGGLPLSSSDEPCGTALLE
ncbi:hypothetical protein [Pseudovibrio brasiliensis]|uniref:DUF4347 domain-containing protein n=1 Tax=Pseudovibrio brasiliensis TaxID=1898042 RepID=A0ABX8AQK7_9HYPH|nr:hypothetical protein [Pseudovibrio brasiliensis]QUS57382.1 hypothetical protein KGB56_08315 [Pseudovibrio brasiliensis]